jgi:16S rRNA G966 N2-methylase RsmD
MSMNKLFYGDNLEVLHDHIADESINLVYLDPPFNSNRSYNVIFARHGSIKDASAQIEAFDDQQQGKLHPESYERNHTVTHASGDRNV